QPPRESYQQENRKVQPRQRRMPGTEPQRDDKIGNRDRQAQYRKIDQSAEEQLGSGTGVFQRLAIDVNTVPDVAANAGSRPESVDRQSQDIEDSVSDGDPEQPRLRHIGDLH